MEVGRIKTGGPSDITWTRDVRPLILLQQLVLCLRSSIITRFQTELCLEALLLTEVKDIDANAFCRVACLSSYSLYAFSM